MTLTDAIQFYQRTATDLSIAIPEELKQAEYRELYKYYAYKLPFILAWGETQAGDEPPGSVRSEFADFAC